MGANRGRPASRGAGAAALAVFLLLGIPANADAAPFASASHHYHFDGPDGWNRSTPSSGEVQYSGPVTGTTRATIIAETKTCSTAANDGAFLLNVARATHDAYKSLFGGTTASASRAFTTTSGRQAADWSVSFAAIGNQRVRQVIFASDAWDLMYILTFTDNETAFDSHNGAFEGLVNSFAVDDETAWGIAVYLVAAAGLGAGVVVSVLIMRRARRGATQPPPKHE